MASIELVRVKIIFIFKLKLSTYTEMIACTWGKAMCIGWCIWVFGLVSGCYQISTFAHKNLSTKNVRCLNESSRVNESYSKCSNWNCAWPEMWRLPDPSKKKPYLTWHNCFYMYTGNVGCEYERGCIHSGPLHLKVCGHNFDSMDVWVLWRGKVLQFRSTN